MELMTEGNLPALAIERRTRGILVKTRTHDTRKLLDEGIGSKEGVVLLGELLDELLVLVEVGDLLDVHAGNTLLLADFLVLIVDEDADVEVSTAGRGEDEGTSETLILGGIVLLEHDLELDSLDEVSLLALDDSTIDLNLLTSGVIKDGLDGLF